MVYYISFRSHGLRTKKISIVLLFGYPDRTLPWVKPTFVSIFPYIDMILHSKVCFIKVSENLEVCLETSVQSWCLNTLVKQNITQFVNFLHTHASNRGVIFIKYLFLFSAWLIPQARNDGTILAKITPTGTSYRLLLNTTSSVNLMLEIRTTNGILTVSKR